MLTDPDWPGISCEPSAGIMRPKVVAETCHRALSHPESSASSREFERTALLEAALKLVSRAGDYERLTAVLAAHHTV